MRFEIGCEFNAHLFCDVAGSHGFVRIVKMSLHLLMLAYTFIQGLAIVLLSIYLNIYDIYNDSNSQQAEGPYMCDVSTILFCI